MELILYAALFYAWECLVYVTRAGGGCVRLPFVGWVPLRGAGVRFLSPWPGSPCLLSSGLPVEIGPEAAFSSEPLRFAPQPEPVPSRRLPLDQGPVALEVRGARVVASGRTFLRTSFPGHARHLAQLLEALASAAPGERRQLASRAVAEACSLSRCRETWQLARQATRPLRWACNAEFLLLFGAAPLLSFLWGGSGAWLALLPAIAVSHAASLAALFVAQRRLALPRGESIGLLSIGALFPPELLRAPCTLVCEALAGFHPATLAALVLPRSDLLRVLRAALGEAEHPRWAREGDGRESGARERRAHHDAERLALLSLVAALEIPVDLVTGRPATDARQPTWCPVCLAEYRPGFARCHECDVATVTFAEPLPE